MDSLLSGTDVSVRMCPPPPPLPCLRPLTIPATHIQLPIDNHQISTHSTNSLAVAFVASSAASEIRALDLHLCHGIVTASAA